MASAFNTILIPVDFSINTELAIKKALELSVPGSTTIHLLHICNGSRNHGEGQPEENKPFTDPEQKLQQWKVMMEDSLEGIHVCCWVTPGRHVHQAVVAKARRIQPDLVIIGKSSHHNWLPFLNTINAAELAAATGSAVLTVKPGAMHQSIKTVVVPVTAETVPQQKMDVLSTLGRRQRLKIHVVGFINDTTVSDSSTGSLFKVYQWLKSRLHCPVEYALLQGNNKPKALLAYAQKINADALLLQPTTETRIGWPNRHITDLLPANSHMQVLTVRHPVEIKN